jgi:formylmethanofuran dehydrogenase subunit C
MPVRFQLTQPTTIPLEVDGITPDSLEGKSLGEIERMSVFHGNRKLSIAEFFSVKGEANDGQIEWEGDLTNVHWIGARMQSGEVRIYGEAGRHVGSEMSGGRIQVWGSAGDWLGAELHGGLIHVRGSAGHLVGAAYRGSSRGMTGGTILVEGSAGNEIGHTMGRGLIAIGGACGDLVGFNLLAGTILVAGQPGIRPGAGMHRGTIGFAGAAPELLPSFAFACRFRPTFVALLTREISRWWPSCAEQFDPTPWDLYHGDLIEGGRGEILVRV